MSQRRKQIIERAASIVYRQGFGGTTIADVLSAASVGKGNFYHYFRGKEDLGLAIIDSLAREFAGHDLDEIFATQKPPLKRLTDYLEIVRSARHAANCGDPLCTLASELGLIRPFSEHLRTAMAAVLDRFEALVSEAALEKGVKVDAKAIARELLAQIHGLCVQYKVSGEAAAFDAGIGGVPALVGVAVDDAKRRRTARLDGVSSIVGQDLRRE
ncbi:MAG TPA: TetR/AcrR family transcriptional regulator [Candidatus Eremiobacteraceae bacterium]|nr:TetR/AcrR family transcriptional regulator [Candidatus Eremiobacteraceae bacterium]